MYTAKFANKVKQIFKWVKKKSYNCWYRFLKQLVKLFIAGKTSVHSEKKKLKQK